MPDRFRLGAKLALILTLIAPIASAQQQNNNNAGGRNGGGPGGGGPGGGGWGGGPGGGGPGGGGWGGGGPGGGTSPTGLIQNPLVQDELKMTDKQKEQVKQISAEAAKKRTQVQENANKLAAAAREQAAIQAAAAAEANGGTPYGNANNGNGNAGNGGGGGRGGRGQQGGRNDPGAQVMRQAMDEFQGQVETALLKILDSKQKTRIKQIALQAEGAGAFDNPEVIEKLGMTQEQVEAIQSINQEGRNSGRQLMGQLFNNDTTGGANNGGGNNGGGRGRFQPPDPATVQTPEFQAKLKSVEEGQRKIEDQTMATVGKALTKAQRATFQKMVGEKFDVAQLRQGFLNRFRPAGTPAATPTATASAAAPAASAAAATTTATKEAAKPARKSLRDARGGSTQP